jgi:curved DNA-binding protein CbpA
MTDYYSVLGVPRTSSAAEIRQAYVKLAKERHPDRFSDPTQKASADEFFKELTAAYNTLSHDERRREYDAEQEKPRLTAPEDIAREAYAQGLQAYENHDFQSAVDLLRTAAHHQPGEAAYLFALGRALGRNPRSAREAIDVVEKAIQIEPTNGGFHAELARLFHGQGLRLRAKKAAEAALRLLPEDHGIQKLAAQIGAEERPGPEGDGGGFLGMLRKKP